MIVTSEELRETNYRTRPIIRNILLIYFSGVKTALHLCIIPSLLKEKPDTVVFHIGSNNITHRIFEDFNADKLTDELTDIGKMCRQYGVKDVYFLLFL